LYLLDVDLPFPVEKQLLRCVESECFGLQGRARYSCHFRIKQEWGLVCSGSFAFPKSASTSFLFGKRRPSTRETPCKTSEPPIIEIVFEFSGGQSVLAIGSMNELTANWRKAIAAARAG